MKKRSPIKNVFVGNTKASRKPSPAVFADLMIARGGIMSAVAKDLGVSQPTLWIWVNEDAELRQAGQAALHGTFDMAMSNILTAISMGDLETSKWYVEKIGKKLNFFEPSESDVSNKVRVIVPKAFEEEDDIDFEVV